MLLISDLDIVAPDDAEKIRQIARDAAVRWEWPYCIALDYMLNDIDRRMSQRLGLDFVPNDVSCRLYEQGRAAGLA